MYVNYLNLYVISILGGLAATIAGIVICYSGISDTSYLSYVGTEMTTFYLDKNQYDFYLYGLVYSLSFGIAFILLLAVILIPSPEQIKKRLSSSPSTGATIEENINPEDDLEPSDEITTESEIKLPENNTNEIELEPEIESFEIEEEAPIGISETSNNDSDVVYGTGKITDSSHKSFILSNPDSAIKFLLRKELDGRPLKSSQDEIYEGWQKRGLSRGKLRKHFLKIMEWDSVPELEVIEIFNKLKDKVYEIKHSDDK